MIIIQAEVASRAEYMAGFREILRVIIQGIAIIVLFSPIMSPYFWEGADVDTSLWFNIDIMEKLLISIIFGFVWFGLSPSKRLKTYRSRVKYIDNKIVEICPQLPKEINKKFLFEYFLVEKASPKSETRVHYFASLYYLLMDVALLSALAALVNFVFVLYLIAFAVPIVVLHAVFIITLLTLFAISGAIAATSILNGTIKYQLLLLEVKKEEVRKIGELATTYFHSVSKYPLLEQTGISRNIAGALRKRKQFSLKKTLKVLLREV